MNMTTSTPTIVNFQSLTPGIIQAINHPAMPDLAKLQGGGQAETWCLIERGKLGAICSLWTDNGPMVQQTQSAALGHFFAQEPRTGALLLDFACRRLHAQGLKYVVGPMDGDSWHSYRLVTVAGTHPPFFLENYTPSEWPAIFIDAGFAAIATYRSAQTTTADYADRSAAKFAGKATAMGLRLRPFNLAQAQAELAALYELAGQSFAQNLFYTPIGLADFLALYTPLLPYVVPELFLLAEHAGRIVGFVLAIPDYAQAARGAPIDTIIVKTLARHPARPYAGLGSYLAQEVHQRAAALGYPHAIHALMHDANVSRTISDKSAQTIRQYALYGKPLY
jgi:L-amino acid N-acyltransferase YncA